MISTVACADCAMAVVNADYSGMDADREAKVRSGLGFLRVEGYRIEVNTDVLTDFSHERCGACHTRLGGYRYDAELIPL